MFIITFPHTNKQETSAMSHFYTRLGGAQWTGRLSEPVSWISVLVSTPALVVLLMEEGAHIQCAPAHTFCENRLASSLSPGCPPSCLQELQSGEKFCFDLYLQLKWCQLADNRDCNFHISWKSPIPARPWDRALVEHSLPSRSRASHTSLFCFGGKAMGLNGVNRELHCSTELSSAMCRVLMWCVHAYRLFWLWRLLESKLWSRLSRRIHIQPWPGDWRCGEDIWAGRGRKKLSPGPQHCVLWLWTHVSVLWRKTRPALNWLILVYMGLTDTGGHTWCFYLCSHSRTSLVPPGCTVLKGGKEGTLQIHVSPPGRAHRRPCVSHGVDGILDTPCLKLAVLPPSYLSRNFWGYHLDSALELRGSGQSSTADLWCT